MQMVFRFGLIHVCNVSKQMVRDDVMIILCYSNTLFVFGLYRIYAFSNNKDGK